MVTAEDMMITSFRGNITGRYGSAHTAAAINSCSNMRVETVGYAPFVLAKHGHLSFIDTI